ncbi:MAG: protease modulator HflC [Candidatus Marinimicrobia bacterium]|nr:protease modulator HflC [Candidatus Neomarinimicrobiota bacterium]
MKQYIALIIIVAGIILFSGSVFIIDESEQAIVIQFGRPIGESITDAGMHYKMPFVQEVLKFDKRLMEWDGEANEIPTKDNKYIFIDTFARWRISDPLRFYKSAKNEYMAQSRLDDIIDGAVRDEISNRVMQEIILSTTREMVIRDIETVDETMEQSENVQPDEHEGARLDIISEILAAVTSNLTDLEMGIEVIDVQLKRINYNKQVREKLFNRMISEQSRIAEKYRAQGQGQKQEIMGLQIQRKKEILSDAYLKSQKIKGEADAEAVTIYAETYGQSEEFFNFIRTLETYEKTLDSSTKLILSTDNPYLKYLNKK